jgi:hypothetical protein
MLGRLPRAVLRVAAGRLMMGSSNGRGAASAATVCMRRGARQMSSGPAVKDTMANMPWYQTERAKFLIGNFSYCLQLAGFVCADQLAMRSFLIGGSSSFIVYALVQPQKMWVPALWEGAFASIHAMMIYKILHTEKITLTTDELRFYGMVFQKHQLELKEFQDLLKLGDWQTFKGGEELTRVGQIVDRVFFITRGKIEIPTKDVTPIVRAEGHFVGEVSLLKDFTDHVNAHEDMETMQRTHAKASGTCVCQGEVQCFVWSHDTLLNYLQHPETNPASAKVLLALFGDVLQKIETI